MITQARNWTLLLGLALAGACRAEPVEKVETTAPVPVTVEEAKIDTLTAALSVAGTVVPAPGADWTITAPSLGHIVELTKAENDVVNPGDVLVRFDVPTITADLAARRADVEQAAARSTTAKANVERLAGLVGK